MKTLVYKNFLGEEMNTFLKRFLYYIDYRVHSSLQTIKGDVLVDEGNAEQWIDKISFLLKNEDTAKEMGKAARQLIIEKFNWDILAKSFLTSVTPIITQKV